MPPAYQLRDVQEVCELEFNLSTLTRAQIVNTQLPVALIPKFQKAAANDFRSFYFRGVLSFLEALKGLAEERCSWATVKLYYSLYYLLRCELLVRGHDLVRSGSSLFFISLSAGKNFIAMQTSNDHKTTLREYIALFNKTDPLLSNSVGTVNAYQWVEDKRVRVNYKEWSFSEPNIPDFWRVPFTKGFSDATIKDTVQHYLDDIALKDTLLEDHAIFGVPVQKLVYVHNLLIQVGAVAILNNDQRKFLSSLRPKTCTNLDIFINV